MSKELKPETIYFAHENGDSCAADMYMKSEVDAILAEKDEEIARLKADAAGDEVPEETPVHEAEQEAPSDKARPPKDYIKKALELIGEQRKGDDSRELFVAEQNLIESIRFIEKHEKKGGA